MNDLKGDSHKRRRHQKEPEPPKNRPECPDYLDDIAKAEWADVTAQLEAMGILSSADRACIEFYCSSYSRFRKAEAMVAKFGEVLISKSTGSPYQSPYSAVMVGSLDTCRRLLVEMELTPASRARCRIQPTREDTGSDFCHFIKKSA